MRPMRRAKTDKPRFDPIQQAIDQQLSGRFCQFIDATELIDRAIDLKHHVSKNLELRELILKKCQGETYKELQKETKIKVEEVRKVLKSCPCD